jgi:hypothetical protein
VPRETPGQPQDSTWLHHRIHIILMFDIHNFSKAGVELGFKIWEGLN